MAKKYNGPPGPMGDGKSPAGSVDHAGRRWLDVGGERVSVSCQWDDHGNKCGEYGVLSDSTNGTGPSYCREHYAKLKGREPRYRGNVRAVE